jgi:hypothetical protein
MSPMWRAWGATRTRRLGSITNSAGIEAGCPSTAPPQQPSSLARTKAA